MTVLIAGGGIAGLTMALTCHQIGVPALVLESARTIAPLGVGINLQPNAIRELFDLGFADELDAIGIEATEWALVGRGGNDVWAEDRGRSAGYDWPQYSVHRGELQMLLFRTVRERLGTDAVLTGHRVVAYRNTAGGVVATVDTRDGNSVEINGTLLLAADGLHSAVRAQMHPNQPEPQWGGQILWRGASLGPPVRRGAAFTLIGTLDQRFVHYPISSVDPDTGLQLQNWIAELTVDTSDGLAGSDWNKQVEVDKFLPAFDDWTFDWLDIPDLVRSAPAVWEFPMVDRDPVDRWVDGHTCLMGDAAHVMYPVGSNGASQAIVDARVMGAKLVEFGVGPQALQAFESQLIEPMSALVLRNRGHGPIGILQVVDERCGGYFDNIDDVMPRAEIEAYMANYKEAAGFAIDALNAAAPTITPGARVGASAQSIIDLCRVLISTRGEASGVALASVVIDRYATLADADKLQFFRDLVNDFDPDPVAVAAAAERFAHNQSADALAHLTHVVEAPRQELLRRLNQAPGATAALVSMRADLLTHLRGEPDLQRLDADFLHLLRSWFNRGFLEMRPITWSSPADVLEKIIGYEAVHEIADWNELRRRLQPPDRRCFAFFHPAMPDDPLVFVAVALTRGTPDTITDLLDDRREPLAADAADTAVFYSISNCQVGLRGVSFGNFLIKQVASDLASELPGLDTFVTLSPAPEFRTWLEGRVETGDSGATELVALIDSEHWADDLRARQRHTELITRLAATYFLSAKRADGTPLDAVARFHLGNGAELERINPQANLTPTGIERSAGMMVNYRYHLARIEENHEAYATLHEVRASDVVRRAAENPARVDSPPHMNS